MFRTPVLTAFQTFTCPPVVCCALFVWATRLDLCLRLQCLDKGREAVRVDTCGI